MTDFLQDCSLKFCENCSTFQTQTVHSSINSVRFSSLLHSRLQNSTEAPLSTGNGTVITRVPTACSHHWSHESYDPKTKTFHVSISFLHLMQEKTLTTGSGLLPRERCWLLSAAPSNQQHHKLLLWMSLVVHGGAQQVAAFNRNTLNTYRLLMLLNHILRPCYHHNDSALGDGICADDAGASTTFQGWGTSWNSLAAAPASINHLWTDRSVSAQ